MKQRPRENHGMSGHPAYSAWKRMISRCENPGTSHFEYYGGRGIKVCDAWQSFSGFWRDMAGTWQEGLSIDRINPDGNYEKNNCRWADVLTQMRNRRTSHKINFEGKTMAASEAALHGSVKYATFLHRINCGMDLAQAMTAQPRSNPARRRVHVDGKIYESLSAAGRALGITRSAIFNRVKLGKAEYVD